MEKSEIRSKTESQLREQVQSVDEAIIDQQIAPLAEGENIFEMSAEELKSRFPKRYQIYLDILRDQKKESPQIGEEDLEKMSKWLYILNSLDRYIASHHKAKESDQTLREKQLDVFEDLRNFLERGGTSGYIKLPTGTGKTVIFSELIEALGLKTIVVVPKKMLVEQTKKTMADFTDDLDIGRIYSDAKEHGRQVTIITYQSLIPNTRRDPSQGYDLMILDEVHKALSHYRSQAIKNSDALIKIGFTATHKFSESKQVSDLLIEEIHNMSVREAVEEGMLSPYSVILIETGTDITQVPIMSTGDYKPDELEKAINISSRNKAALEVYQRLFPRQKSIAYCQGVQHAKDLAEIFKQAGIKAAVIHGEQNIGEQMRLKRQFESGEIMVLCNSDILIEGFDEPSASVCLNLRPTLSPVVAEQRGGRVLRLDPKNSDKVAAIVDFIDKTDNRRNIQVTFTEVSGAAFVSSKEGANPRIHDTQNFDETIKIIFDPKEVAKYVSEMTEKRKETAPMGWLSRSGVSRFINSRAMVIEHTVNKYREMHPEWFGMYMAETRKYREFYSPELIEVLREELRAKVIAPPDWQNIDSLSSKTRRTHMSVSKAVGRLGKDHPEWFKNYLTPAGIPEEYYSPELSQKILDHFQR